MLGTAGMFGMFFPGSLYLRRILGYDPLRIGLAFLPVAVVMGTGAGLCSPALMTLAMSSATPRDAGLASGLVVAAGVVAATVLRSQPAPGSGSARGQDGQAGGRAVAGEREQGADVEVLVH